SALLLEMLRLSPVGSSLIASTSVPPRLGVCACASLAGIAKAARAAAAMAPLTAEDIILGSLLCLTVFCGAFRCRAPAMPCADRACFSSCDIRLTAQLVSLQDALPRVVLAHMRSWSIAVAIVAELAGRTRS